MDTSFIGLCTEIWVANAFTPDGNGTNDFFFAKASQTLIDFKMQIYTRWGEMIFESNDIFKGWDGTYKDSPAPCDVYVYIITYHAQGSSAINKEGLLRGTVTLVR